MELLHGADPATAHGAAMGPCEILPGQLWLGAAPAGNPDTCATLARAGVTHVVNCTETAPYPTPEQVPGRAGAGVVGHRIPVEDTPGADIAGRIEGALDFMRGAVRDSGVVYVHCAMGVSRSSTVVIAYRMSEQRETLREAYERVKEARPVISPNLGFFRVLVELEERASKGTCTLGLTEYATQKLQEDMKAYAWTGIDAAAVSAAVEASNGDIERAKAALEMRVRNFLDDVNAAPVLTAAESIPSAVPLAAVSSSRSVPEQPRHGAGTGGSK